MKTEIIRINDPDETRAIRRAAKLLEDGALVAFPTETVYGIGCRVEAAALDRLDRLKGREPQKRYTLHLGRVDQIGSYVPRMSLRAAKLVQHTLPGPVTLVFELEPAVLDGLRKQNDADVARFLYADNTLGIRCPDHPIASAILAAAKCPVIAPSVNPAGKTPASNVMEALAYFDGQLDAVIDSPAYESSQKSSTVVKIGKTHLQILRQGAVAAELISKLATIRILFVCTGNTCRSPMAEVICKKHFCDILGCLIDELPRFGYIVESAGVAAMTGMPASEHAVQVCRRHGIQLEEHQSVPLTPQRIDESDRLFVMSQSHLQSILEFFPEAAEKCFLLDENRDIADPIGQDIEVYQRCFNQMEKAIKQRVSEIL